MVAFYGLGEKVHKHYGAPAARLVGRIIAGLGLPYPQSDEFYHTKEEGRFLVFLNGLGCVLSVRSSDHNVPANPHILKPLQRYVDRTEGINIELFPSLKANIQKKDCEKLSQKLCDHGIEWKDSKPDNAGYLAHHPVVLDLDSYDFSFIGQSQKTMRAPAPLSAPEEKASDFQDQIFQPIKKILWNAWQPNALPDRSLMDVFWKAARAEVRSSHGCLVDPELYMARATERHAAASYRGRLTREGISL